MCSRNAGRSQMAAALLNVRAGGRVIVSSAGTDWPIRDPDGAPLEVVRAIRDEIKTRVQAQITEIDAQQES
ncbi:hypothetical protein AB0B54_33585 [Microbispora bryophytorum]|uniref:arsenate reductase/protein-tyrosine-phosphatase family protein n=1 Tax=Microbispora bryophytorum TaxID=1460882 RepID=UPI0033DA7002